MNTIIRLENVSVKFKRKILFSDINLEISEGDAIGLVGENGSGKSVLFKVISGLYRPSSGRVFVWNKEIGIKSDFPSNMGIFIDSPSFIDIYSGYTNLKLLADIRGVIDEEKIRDTMQLVGLDPDLKTIVKNYSLGMRQKLGIAQAFMENQQILLLDEPFNALDEESHTKMLELLNKLNQDGRTILLTSHNSSDINSLCSNIYRIRNQNLKLVTKND